MTIYGQRPYDICHPYITDMQQCTYVIKFPPKTYIFLPNHTYSRCKMDFVDSLLKLSCSILWNIV